MLLKELLEAYQGTLDKALCDKLDNLAQGADEVEYQGVKYVRTGPKNQVSEPGPWRKAEGATS